MGAKAYVVDSESKQVSVIDTCTDQLTGAPIGVGTQPFGMRGVRRNRDRFSLGQPALDAVDFEDQGPRLELGPAALLGVDVQGLALLRRRDDALDPQQLRAELDEGHALAGA